MDVPIPISQCLTYPFATIPSATSNVFISQTTQSTVDAYAGISIDGSGNITLTANHTINELYDFVQSYCSKSANILVPASISTSDGTKFICSKNLTVSNCVLTAVSGQSLAMGSNTLAFIGTGSYLGNYTDSAGTHLSTIVSGFITGSDVVWLDPSVVGNGSGNNVLKITEGISGISDSYASTGAGLVDIGIFKPGYRPLYIRGVTPGSAIPVSQQLDLSYAA